jgi:FtsZ-binding cell division protein ZapB
LTTELERIKILEGKISQVVDYISRLTAENDKLKLLVKELKAGAKDYEEQAKKMAKVEEDLTRYENEREAIRDKVEIIIGQIDKLGI